MGNARSHLSIVLSRRVERRVESGKFPKCGALHAARTCACLLSERGSEGLSLRRVVGLFGSSTGFKSNNAEGAEGTAVAITHRVRGCRATMMVVWLRSS